MLLPVFSSSTSPRSSSYFFILPLLYLIHLILPLPFHTPSFFLPPQGRGSGFPGRRRSRGGGLGGGRGGRGRSRLKTQDTVTVSPGVRTQTLLYFVTQLIDRGCRRYWFLSPSVRCVRGAVPAKGGGGELNAQHGGDVLHLRPLHPQTGTPAPPPTRVPFKIIWF